MEFVHAVFNKNTKADNLGLGDMLSLWDVARNKIIGLSTLSIYYRQAKDAELKDLVKNGIDFVLAKHVNKIQKVLKGMGYEFPTEQNWKRKLNDDSPFVLSSLIIDDEEIAMSLREIIRLTLSLEAEAIRNTSDEDIKNLLVNMLDDDNTAYSAVLALQRKRNWKDFPPALLPH
jgi:uncharacterized protein YbaP (TraB family)